jgi:hypothetical protein
MTDEINKLKEAGFNDADIQAYINDQKNRAGKPAAVDPAQVDSTQPIIVDEKIPQYSVQEETIMPSMGQAAAMLPAAGNAVVAAAPYVAGAAGLYGGGRLVGAVKTAADAYKTGVATAADTAQRQIALQEAKIAERAARAGQQVRPVVPTAPAGVPTAPVAGPVAPVAQAAEQGLANRVKQTAAQRITGLMPSMGEALGTAGRFAGRVLGPASLALESRDLGPPVPTTGRMKGMEINPLTRAPWTREQLAQYEANPGLFDQQMSPPQFRR